MLFPPPSRPTWWGGFYAGEASAALGRSCVCPDILTGQRQYHHLLGEMHLDIYLWSRALGMWVAKRCRLRFHTRAPILRSIGASYFHPTSGGVWDWRERVEALARTTSTYQQYMLPRGCKGPQLHTPAHIQSFQRLCSGGGSVSYQIPTVV